MIKKRIYMGLLAMVLLSLAGVPISHAVVKYTNDFNNPSSPIVSEAYPEWIDFGGNTARAVNGRIEWYDSGGNDDWIRLDIPLGPRYSFEFDFFYQENINGRFSVWPFCKPGDSIYERHNYFLRKNTHYFNGADTVPSEGPRDMTVPVGAKPHRVRIEVTGDHVVFLYKHQGDGPWVKVDERDFPTLSEPRYIQLGYNHDGGTGGVHYIDNFVLNVVGEGLFFYSNTFDNPSSNIPHEAYPEWVDFGGNTARAVNGRIEWYDSGGNDDWIRLDKELPTNYTVEFDFFYQENINGRFSVWPFCKPGDSIYERHNYFLRKNTHYFNGADTVPSEGPRDLTLPVGSKPHRLRFEITGNHVVFLFKDRGEGGWIKVDERDFPAIDPPRYFQLGYNHDGGTGGTHYIDNLIIQGMAENRAEVSRDIGADNFLANTPIPVKLQVRVTGTLPSMTLREGLPDGWSASAISNNGVLSNGEIVWSLSNLTQSVDLTYNAIPPRLVRERVAAFSGSVDSGEGEERIAGETAISIKLPYLYRETIDYDFSGSPQNGKKYPTGTEFGVRYAQGMDGIPSDTPYVRPGGGGIPAIDTVFNFPANADFYVTTGTGGRGGTYTFEDYRDQGEVVLEHGASDTNAGVGSETMAAGDWYRYTFDLGEGDQVLLLNLSINTWGQGECQVDVYVDNKFKGVMVAPGTDHNAFYFFTVGPFEVTGGEHAIVLALPGPAVPDGLGRMEVVRVKGIGHVTRLLTPDGFFDPDQPFTVTLQAQAEYGTYTPIIEENVPRGTISEISHGGQIEGGKIYWELDPTSTSSTVTYKVTPPAGAKFVLFDGYCHVGLPLAKAIRGDTSVTNQRWLFGETLEEKRDEFTGSALAAPWTVEYGNDPSLSTNYREGVTVTVENGTLILQADPFGQANKFNEWSNGRRAPMILRTDIPAGDWRIETKYSLKDAFTWSNYHVGLVIAYNQGNDTDVTGDEYLFGFYGGDLRVELTNKGTRGILQYHNYTDENDWIDFLLSGGIQATIAVTKRGNELIFSAQLPNRTWQLVGAPVTETRTPTRIGLFAKIIGGDDFVGAAYEYFTLSAIDAFTDVEAWMLF
ncbi:MAG TPA: Ig-like domain-containing protein [bacterium]|nr:Ig-like domain-containing protein [bacterium]